MHNKETKIPPFLQKSFIANLGKEALAAYFKMQAEILYQFLNSSNNKISISSCYEALAQMYGFKNWNILSAKIKNMDKEKKSNMDDN